MQVLLILYNFALSSDEGSKKTKNENRQKLKIMYRITWEHMNGQKGTITASSFNTIEDAKRRIKQLNAMRGNWYIIKYAIVEA